MTRYKIMLKCWDVEPKKRPSFSKLSECLGDLLEESTKRVSIELLKLYF